MTDNQTDAIALLREIEKWDADYSDTANISDNLNWERFDEIMRRVRILLKEEIKP